MPKPPNRNFRIYNEDCFKTFKRIKDQSIDMVMVDPPYGTTACKWDSIIPLEPMWKELKRVIKPNGAILIMASQPFTTILIGSNLKQFKYVWIWDKVQLSGFLLSKKMPLRKHEEVCTFYKKPPNYNPQMGIGPKIKRTEAKQNASKCWSGLGGLKSCSPGKESNSTEKRYPTTIIQFSKGRSPHNVHSHPTQKPVALMEYLIKTYTNEGETVLDFAMGSGTTGVACMNLGRKFIGCDNDVEHGYFEIAKERIEKANAKSK